MKHTVGCLRQHRWAWFVLGLVVSGGTDSRDVLAGWPGCGWGWCVLFENCTVDASIFNCL